MQIRLKAREVNKDIENATVNEENGGGSSSGSGSGDRARGS
jgi:hypothetical protein